LLLIALPLLLTEVGLAARDLHDQRSARGGPQPAPIDLPFLGITADLLHLPPTERAALTAELAAAGFGWVRIRLPWDEIEAQPQHYQWAEADAAIAATTAAGLTPILLLDGSPIWARAAVDRTTAAGHLAPPADPATFARFAQAVAQRYHAQVRYYQIWDEPNIAPHWGARHINPVAYAHLLKLAAHALRRHDPDAQILTAALAPTVDRGHLAQDEAYFLRRLYAAGAAADFDFVALQPFGFATRPDTPTVDRFRLNFNRARLVRALMREAGDATTPIWLMRYGWNRLPGSPWRAVSPETQAAFAVEALDGAYRGWPWVAAQGWADAGMELAPDDPRRGFALTPALVTALRGWQEDAAQPRHAQIAPLAPRAPLPLLAWSVLTLVLLGRGLVLLRGLLWSQWRACAAAARWYQPFWLIGLWGTLLLVYYFATWPPLILLCWLLAAALIYLRPELGLALTLLCIPFHAYHKEFAWVDLRWAVPPAYALLVCLLPTALVARPRLRLRDRWDRWALAWLAIALLGITGAWYAPDFRQGLLAGVLLPLWLFFLLRQGSDTPDAPTRYLAALALGGVLAAAVGLGDWLAGGGTVADGIRRLTAPAFSPNQTALYLVRSLFVLLGFVVVSERNLGVRRWAGRGALGLVGLALLLTGSRGGLLLGLPVGGWLWWRLHNPPTSWPRLAIRWRWAIGLLLVGLGWWAAARLGNLATVTIRLEGWHAAWQLGRDYPWFGVGPNGFWTRFPAYIPVGSTLDPDLRHPHNVWLEFFTGGGVAALIWLGVALTWCVHSIRRSRPSLTPSQVGLWAALAAGLAHSQVDAFQALPELALWNWAALALILAHQSTQTKAAGPVTDGFTNRS
jgi:O-antigen ligase